MPTLLLIRHGRTTANASGILAGRTPGVSLDDRGREQAQAASERISGLDVASAVSSPLDRCVETAEIVVGDRNQSIVIENDITECDYGDWQGGKLSELAERDLWQTVQTHPSRAHFPGGESMQQMQSRAVAAIRRHDARVEAEHGPNSAWVAVSHGDIIKSILADALGMHLDLFQRLSVHPASISVVHYGSKRPDVVAVNSVAGDLAWLGANQTAETVGGGDATEQPERT